MKTISLICLSILFFSFTRNSSLNEEYSKIIFNGKTLYISKYEVSNGNYYQFLDDIKYDGKLLTKARVYSQNWKDVEDFSIAFKDYYFGNEAYSNYPVVNISHEAAALYCTWLSKKMSEELNTTVIARLPTKEEWIYAAKATNTNALYTWTDNQISEKIAKEYANFTEEEKQNIITAPVDAYKANAIGLHNCSGNVAEMIQTEGIALGGDWSSTLSELAIDNSEKTYTSANPYTGFRVILEIK